jgi:uncharacterized protein (DUF2147 family)
MRTRFLAALGAALLYAPLSSAATPAAPPPTPTEVTGFWQSLDDDGHPNAWFYFAPKADVYEGRIVKMFKKAGLPDIKVCAKCGGDQQNAAMLGLVIVKKMKRDGLKYHDGFIMDPRDGDLYHAQMEMSADGKQLFVRGYLLMPALGQTQTWTRLPDNSIPKKDIPKESHNPDAPTDTDAEQ